MWNGAKNLSYNLKKQTNKQTKTKETQAKNNSKTHKVAKRKTVELNQ